MRNYVHSKNSDATLAQQRLPEDPSPGMMKKVQDQVDRDIEEDLMEVF